MVIYSRKNKAAIVMIAIILFVSTVFQNSYIIKASSKYITAKDFIKKLVTAMELEIDTTVEDPYVAAAIAAGVYKTEDGINLTKPISRTDAALLLNRADEKLHGDKVDKNLVSIVLKKRISDIKKIPKAKREAVAKVVAKGIIKGYFNGYYIQNRSFKGSSYITNYIAKNFIDLTINPKKRAKISWDGELIRTTNLPKNAKNYEYILECYPNRFYEKKFEFMLTNDYKEKSYDKYFDYPVEMRTRKFKNWYDEWDFSIEMDKYLDDWTDLAETYLQYVFNVDYRTVDSKWVNGLGSLYTKSNYDEAEDIRNYYIKDMKANKVSVESSIISVEPSTLYYSDGYCMRAYVKYRITAKNVNVDQSKLIYAQYPNLLNLKSRKWREGIFDVRFSTSNGSSGDGSYFAIDIMTRFNDTFNVSVK